MNLTREAVREAVVDEATARLVRAAANVIRQWRRDGNMDSEKFYDTMNRQAAAYDRLIAARQRGLARRK